MHFQGRPEHGCTVFHDPEAHAGHHRLASAKSPPIVADRKLETVAGILEADDHPFGAPVLDGIGDGFLRNAVQVGRRASVRDAYGQLPAELAPDVEQLRGIIC